MIDRGILSEIEIRPIEYEDYDQALDLLVELQNHLGNLDVLREICVGPEYREVMEGNLNCQPTLVAVWGDEVVGVAVMRVYPESYWAPGFSKHRGLTAEIENLIVKAAYRSNGIAKSILWHCIQYLKDIGCVRVDISFLETNVAARNLYTNYGFKPAIRTSSMMLFENF